MDPQYTSMTWPYCRKVFVREAMLRTLFQIDETSDWAVEFWRCAACDGLIVDLLRRTGSWGSSTGFHATGVSERTRLNPRHGARPPAPPEVPSDIAEDYREASLVLGDSPKAAAALGRRCLQGILRTAAGVKPGNLAAEIQEVLDSGQLPSYLSENLDAIHNIGNFSAHPMKSTQSGAILPVEPHEAEWTLDVLEELFDFYYVQPALAKAKRDALNQKLAEAGKPPMKGQGQP